MKAKYKEYYTIEDEEINILFKNAFVVLDTNVLLNLYRYSSQTNDKFFEVLTKLKVNLWMPYQIGKEFHIHRIDEIITQRNIYVDSKKEISNLKQKFEDKNRNPFISPDNLRLFENLITELDNSAKKYDVLLKDDFILKKLNELFENSTGDAMNEDILSGIYKEGKIRYQLKIPPGFADEKDKPEDSRKYGDLVIWKQLIEHAKSISKPCLFITDDRKNDWWLIDKNKNIQMPHPQLLREFSFLTNQEFYAYQPIQFLEIAKAKLSIDITQDVLTEVEDSISSSVNEFKGENFILKETVLNSVNELMELLINDGYDVSYNQIAPKTYKIFVLLPPIRDIKRLFYDKIEKLSGKFEIEFN